MIIKSIFNDVAYGRIWICILRKQEKKKLSACEYYRHWEEESSNNLIKIMKQDKIDPFKCFKHSETMRSRGSMCK